jgi:PAS domain S-box-containing protein
VVAAFVCSYLLARLGLLWAVQIGAGSPYWPAAGVAIASGYFLGPMGALGSAVGTMLARPYDAFPPWAHVAFATGNFLGPWIASVVLRRIRPFRPQLDRPVCVAALVAGMVCSASIAASLGTATLASFRSVDWWEVFGMWWIGHGLGILTLGALLMTFFSNGSGRRSNRLAVSIAAAIPSSAMIVLVYSLDGLREFRYLVSSLLMMSALMAGPLGAAVGVTLVGTSAVFVVSEEPGRNLINVVSVQAYIGVISVVMLTLAAVVAQRDRAEELRAREEQFVTMAEASPDFLWTFDVAGRAQYANPQMLRGLATDLDRLSGEGWLESLHLADREWLVDRWRQSAREARPLIAEVRLTANDEPRWYRLRMLPIDVRDGTPRLWQGLFTDIHDKRTEADRLDQIVRQRTSDLRRTNQDLERFSYSVSHDLRAPLRSIVSASHILREDFGEQLPEEAQRLLNQQAQAALRMSQLIDALLNIARLGQSQMSYEELDVTAMGKSVAGELKPSDGVELVIEEGLKAQADPKFLRLVLQNLFDNAFKYRMDGRMLRVRFGYDPEKGAFFVEDNGIGFDPAFAKRVFEPFERLEPSMSVTGTGIGLANVKQAIERHEGEVWAESRPEMGSTFYFTLPLVPGGTEQVAQ